MKIKSIAISAIVAIFSITGCTKHASSLTPDGATTVSSDTVSLDGSSNGSGNGGYGSNNRYASSKNSVHFAFDSNKISREDKEKIDRSSYALKQKNVIRVEGNSDEYGTDEYNYALGLRRAKAVKQEMIAKGVPATKIKVISYGESNPECKDHTKKCYKKNRRADYL